MSELCSKLSNLLRSRIDCTTIMLSGGIDSSLLSILGKGILENGITVAYKDAPDLIYARMIAEECNLRHMVRMVDDDNIFRYAKEVIRIMRSFSPIEVRNSIVLYASMLEAKDNSINCIITGDGADELFAGYNYLLRPGLDLEYELDRLLRIMSFSSISIARDLDIRVSHPYLSEDVIKFARELPTSLKVREYDGVRYGKWILRECLIHYSKIAFRKKMAMEEGSGISNISSLFDTLIDDMVYEEEKRRIYEEGVRIRSKEHLYYYKVFRGLYGIPRYDGKGRCCSDCLSLVSNERYCKVCGAFPLKPIYIY